MTVVDVVDNAGADGEFQGIYWAALPDRCWNRKGTHIFFSTDARSRKVII